MARPAMLEGDMATARSSVSRAAPGWPLSLAGAADRGAADRGAADRGAADRGAADRGAAAGPGGGSAAFDGTARLASSGAPKMRPDARASVPRRRGYGRRTRVLERLN